MFRKIYARDTGRCFMPVYVPQETYSFVINGDPITDPDFDNFVLQLENQSGVIVNSDVAQLKKITNVNYSYPDGVVMPYWIYCVFTFPIISQGQYRFVIYDTVNDIVKCKSNTILCEQMDFSVTSRIDYKHSASRGGYPYSRFIEDGVEFSNMFRIPVSMNTIQFESERSQYRNATDQRFRNVRSYLDYGYKLELTDIDQSGLKALADLCECDQSYINNELITPKTQISEEPISNSVLSRASFETYINQDPFDSEDLRLFGQYIIYTGDPGYNPLLVYNSNEP